jgi:carbon monoxide dehydrogenase subunit G
MFGCLLEDAVVEIRNQVVVQRPRQEVFDRLSDPRSELQWNPKVELMEALDDELFVGARFRAKWKLSKPMTLTITRFDRPDGWSHSNDGPIEVDLDVDLEDHPEGTLLRSSFRPRAHGIARLMFPVFLFMIRREEKDNMRYLKGWLEGTHRL